MEFILHILEHAFTDTIRLAPFLFLTYLAMEYLENKAGEKTVELLLNTGKKGPVLGGILGVLPQCGFSAAAAGLYSGGVITVGTMLAVFLSTSDEMLPIFISERAPLSDILWILGAKIVIGIVAGSCVDWAVRFLNKGNQKGLHIHDICERENCHCEEGSILKSALIHSVQILVFLFLVAVVLEGVVEWVGMEKLVTAVSRYPVLSVFVSGLIGLIPNCAASVTITTLYLEGVLSAGSMMAGLLSCAGIGLLVLFRTNHGVKKNLMITGALYGISVASGLLTEVLFRIFG